MMTTETNPSEIDITCPHCGKQFHKAVERLKQKPTTPCPGCYAAIKVEPEWLLNNGNSSDKSSG